MITEKLKDSFWDGLGATLSLACAVHCAILPFLLALLPLAGIAFLRDERVETGMIVVSLSVATFALARGFGWHRDFRAPALGLLGVAIWGAGRTFLEQPWEGLAMGLGGFHFVAAHWLNLRLCNCCESCKREMK
jgi:MerC mercury resistance protein